MADSSDGFTPDPFETLKRQEAGMEAALPAAEVRVRGDRMRRRRTAFRAVAAAAAVAVVTTGGVALGGQLTGAPVPLPPATDVPSARPTPSETPTAPPSPSAAESDSPDASTWITEIPEGFPLALGYPEDRFEETQLTGPAEGVPVFESLHACDATEKPRAGGQDRLGVSFTQPEDTRARLLTTFDDALTAGRVFARYEAMYRACPREELGSGSTILVQVSEADPGDEAFVAIRTYEQDEQPVPGLELIYVVRVGNALLLQSTSNEGGGNEKLIYAQVREQTGLVAELADAMCLFSRAGCSPTADDAKSQAAEVAEEAARSTFGPDGFAGVELGMTGGELESSGRVTLEPGSQAGCSDFVLLSPDGSEQIGGGYLSEENGVEDITLDVNGEPTRARTPEGITPVSTLQQVQATYPEGEWFDPTYVAPVPGFDDRRYSFTFAGGEATGLLSMGLHLRAQSCTPSIGGTSSAP